jgi:hypothetical protein
VECTVVEGELIPFHFGTLAGDERDALERHLCSCSKCLTAFLEVKRAIESGRDLSRKPSPVLRSRLRAEVAMEFAPRRRARAWVGAAAAVLVGATLVGVLARHKPPVEPPTPMIDIQAQAAVDTARPVTAGLRFY